MHRTLVRLTDEGVSTIEPDAKTTDKMDLVRTQRAFLYHDLAYESKLHLTPFSHTFFYFNRTVLPSTEAVVGHAQRAVQMNDRTYHIENTKEIQAALANILDKAEKALLVVTRMRIRVAMWIMSTM